MANKILYTTIMQKNTNGDRNIIYPKTVTKNIIDGTNTLEQTLNTLKSHDVSDKTITFTEALTRENLVSGETLATSQGKIKKLISDLKSLAYADTIGVSNLDSTLVSAYNNRVTTDKVTTSTTITSDGYVADARAVNSLQNQINTVNSNITELVYSRSKGIFSRNSIVYVGEMSNLATSAMHFKIDRSAYYDGVGSMDVWINGLNGMMCKYEGGSFTGVTSLDYIKNIAVYKKDSSLYVYVIAPNYNDSWRLLDYGTRGDARFDCKVVDTLPTDSELIYDLSSGKGLVGDSYINGSRVVTENTNSESIMGEGWYRFAKFKGKGNEFNGGSGNSVAFTIKTFFTIGGNSSDFVLLNSSHLKSNFTVLGASRSGSNVSKVRHVHDTVNNVSYLEFYYSNPSTTYSNPVGVELHSGYDGRRRTKWEIMDFELTEETVSGVTVYSAVDLITKDRHVVTNSDLGNGRFIITSGDTLADIKSDLSVKLENYTSCVFIAHDASGTFYGGIAYNQAGTLKWTCSQLN